MTGVDRIRAERQRQLEVEGYGIEHDRLHGEWALSAAAIAYAIGSAGEWVRELAKAGALIAAAIDAEFARLAEAGIGTVLAQDQVDNPHGHLCRDCGRFCYAHRADTGPDVCEGCR